MKEKQKLKTSTMDFKMEDDDFINKKSSASTYVDDIKSIVFGGMNSRFWMLRKHFNSMSSSELGMVPFHCWDCLSIQLNHREVDIVIKDKH